MARDPSMKSSHLTERDGRLCVEFRVAGRRCRGACYRADQAARHLHMAWDIQGPKRSIREWQALPWWRRWWELVKL